MTDNYAPPIDDELHAFIDGELDDARAAKVAEAILGDPTLALKVTGYRADKLRLMRVYGPLIDRPLPRAWMELIQARNTRPRFGTWRRIGLALAASLLIGVLGGWLVYGGLMPRGGEALVLEAVAAHGGSSGAAAEPAAAAAAGLLANNLGLPLKAPDLEKMGFMLVAVEDYAAAPGGKAVKLAYRDGQNRSFTLYLKPSPGTPRFDMIKRGTTRICIWQDDVLSTIMLGDMSAGEMLRLASLAYSGLNS